MLRSDAFASVDDSDSKYLALKRCLPFSTVSCNFKRVPGRKKKNNKTNECAVSAQKY